MSKPLPTMARLPTLCRVERVFRRAIDLTGLTLGLWEVLEAPLGDALEFVELAYATSPGESPWYRSLLALGPNEVVPGVVGAAASTELLGMFSPLRGATPVLDGESLVRPEWGEERAILYGRGGVMLAPLRRGDLLVGGLAIGVRPDVLSEAASLGALRRLERRVRVAVLRRLELCRRVDAQSRAFSNVLTLLNMVRRFGTHRNPNYVAGLTLDFLVSELGFRQALIARVETETATLFGTDSRGFEDVHRLVRFNYPVSPDFLSRSVRDRAPVLFDGACDDDRLPVFLQDRGIRQGVVVPMLVEEQVIGVLLLDNDPDQRPLTPEDLELIQNAADLLGQSLYVSSLYQTLRRTAETDPLTGVYNRHALNTILEDEVPRLKRTGQSLSLLMVDLCDFKKFNDLYGHLVGDQILKTVARLLLQCTRKSDRVVRFGGDEFLVLMPNTPEERARMVKDRIENSVREHNERTQLEQEHFLLSIGLRSAEGEQIDNIIEDADEEMYRKKAAQSRQKLYNAFTSNNPDDLAKSDSFVAVLIKNLLEREPHFLDHARMVMVWSQAICQLIGADDDYIERVSLASLLHDIGKIALPSGLLSKAQPLTKEDRRHIRLHPMAGSDFLSGHEFLSDLRIIINHHHERWDGKTSGAHPGYPSGLAGELIPLGSRIIRIAETFDDLVSPRPYRPRPMTTQKALEVLRSEEGHALDPHLTRLFVQYVEMVNQPLASLMF